MVYEYLKKTPFACLQASQECVRGLVKGSLEKQKGEKQKGKLSMNSFMLLNFINLNSFEQCGAIRATRYLALWYRWSFVVAVEDGRNSIRLSAWVTIIMSCYGKEILRRQKLPSPLGSNCQYIQHGFFVTKSASKSSSILQNCFKLLLSKGLGTTAPKHVVMTSRCAKVGRICCEWLLFNFLLASAQKKWFTKERREWTGWRLRETNIWAEMIVKSAVVPTAIIMSKERKNY